MNDVGIRLYRGQNPFAEWPALRSIWPEPHRSLAEEAVVEHLQQMKDVELGDIQMILLDGRTVGISGYFPYDAEGTNLGLRWHGILPEVRGQGISAKALQLVARRAIERFPQAGNLIELVPLTDEGEVISSYFSKLGFAPVGEPETYEWAEHAWQPYAINLRTLAAAPRRLARRRWHAGKSGRIER